MALIIGVGNQSRGDDGAGLLVAQGLRALRIPSADVMESDGDASDLMEAWQTARSVFVIDAARSNSAPGTVFRFDAQNGPINVRMGSRSTHDLGLPEAIELARALGYLPPRCVLYAIEGQDFALGAPMSPPVERACQEVVARVAAEVRSGIE